MLDYDGLWRCFADLGLDSWRPALEGVIRKRLSEGAHGDFSRWRKTIEQLSTTGEDQQQEIRDLLLTLSPWRKGPFEIAGITIDSEWRSDLKWDRLKNFIAPLDGRNILDVGCGNGYYALRMRELGAQTVIGIDPTLLFVMQFLAVQRFQRATNVFVLPLRSDDLPDDVQSFDTCFSMGVLYHQRSPLAHLQQLKRLLRPGGQLVLETIFLPGDKPYAWTPTDRYARMRNVWLLPTIAELTTWLQRSGFRDIDVIDQSTTSTDEQRSTEWMTSQSLAEALDPSDPSQTIEGWPAPQRAVVLANAP
jgi:tRNA (mo5U34)-methyltransferase